MRQTSWQDFGLIRDREFDLEQEQRPGAGRDAGLQRVLAVLVEVDM